MRHRLKKISALKFLVITARTLKNKYTLIHKIKLLNWFFSDYRKYKAINTNTHFSFKTEDLFPRIYDKTATHSLDPVYFYQDNWCARKVVENKPRRHYDIGSKVEMVAFIAQIVPTTMIDIRPLSLPLDGLSFIEGDVTKLPFKDNEIESLSSICVLEHIGLGRYGDPLDPFGSEKAIAEVKRVLAMGGSLYISLPIDSENRTYFNAHRAFTREYIVELFSPLVIVEEKYIYGKSLENKYDQAKGFGTGLYHLKK